MNRGFQSRVAVTAAILALSPLALAQAQQDRPDRAVSSSPEILLRNWQADHGPNWHLRSNRNTGTLEMLYGGKAEPVFEANVNRNEDWYRLTRYWLAQSSAMHGVLGQDLVEDKVVFLPLAQSNTTDKMTVSLRQQIGGIPVEDGRVNALYDLEGSLLSLHTTAAPSVADRRTKPTFSERQARAKAPQVFAELAGVPALEVREANLVFAHVDDQEVRRWTLAWQIDVQNIEAPTPVGKLITLDAHTGEFLKSAETVHFFDVNGTINAMASPGTEADHPGNPPVATPVPYVQLNSSAGTTFTDGDGNFSYPGVNSPLNITVAFNGTYTNANNDQGADYSVTFNNVQPNQSNTLLMNASPTEFVTAEANAYISIAELRDWITTRIPTDTTPNFNGPANCNLDSSCNAFFNGNSTNYYNEAGSCNNTAFSAVVAHEMGHWLNVLYGTGNGSDGIGEGNADVFALYLYDDPVMGRFFFTTGGSVRNGNNTRQYCGDGNGGCYGGVHADGEVWMGAAWNIREYLNASMGNAAGDLHADLLFLGWMNSFNQTTIDSIMEIQWLTLDDDDGNINNGTPNYQDIDDGFTDQGFPGFDLPFITFANEDLIDNTTNEVGPYVASIDMVASFNPPVAAGTLHYQVNNGAWQEVAMVNTSGNTWSGGIPGVPSPATVLYYFEGEDNTGGTSTFPESGQAGAFTFYVGIFTEFLVNDFEGATNEGWVSGAPGDDATTGIWERGDPIGTASQPEDDHTGNGVNCWFTGQGSQGGSLGQNDVDGGTTTLLSPIFDATGAANPEISYWRWFDNNGNSTVNDTLVIDISNDGGSSWVNVETIGPNGFGTDGGWLQHSFDVTAFVTPTNNMRMRFQTSDLNGGSIVEAAIDDVQGFSLDPSSVDLGTKYCTPAVPNSTGFPAFLSAVGNPNAAANDVTLTVTLLPTNEFGYFLNGTAQDFITPPGSSGNLCLGGSLGRYNALPEIFNSGIAGTGSLVLDLTNTPSALGPQTIMSGETWNFQCWYRDSADVTSNFSDAVSVTFN